MRPYYGICFDTQMATGGGDGGTHHTLRRGKRQTKERPEMYSRVAAILASPQSIGCAAIVASARHYGGTRDAIVHTQCFTPQIVQRKLIPRTNTVRDLQPFVTAPTRAPFDDARVIIRTVDTRVCRSGSHETPSISYKVGTGSAIRLVRGGRNTCPGPLEISPEPG